MTEPHAHVPVTLPGGTNAFCDKCGFFPLPLEGATVRPTPRYTDFVRTQRRPTRPVHRTPAVLDEVQEERREQDRRWGPERNYHDGTGRPGDRERADAARARNKANDLDGDNWRDILEEEVMEAFAETDYWKLRHELVQTAATAVQWIEALDRRHYGS
jgi:hypothetical protein